MYCIVRFIEMAAMRAERELALDYCYCPLLGTSLDELRSGRRRWKKACARPEARRIVCPARATGRLAGCVEPE